MAVHVGTASCSDIVGAWRNNNAELYMYTSYESTRAECVNHLRPI